MTLTLPLEASPASPILDVPSIALLVLALISLVFDAGQGQALNGLFDALGERREGQGDER